MRCAAACLTLLALLVAGACSSGESPGAAATPVAGAASPAGPGPGALTQDACRALTAADVQAALGIPVTQLPLTSPPPGAGPGTSLVSGCTYASASAAPGGASLYLYRDLKIDYFAGVPGVQRVPDVGDAAYEHGSMLLGRKGHVTFQLTIESGADPAETEPALRALARAVSARL